MLEEQVRRFREFGWRFVAALTGGGSAFVSDYLAIPGASATFLEGVVPYSTSATDAFLGFKPESYCSEKTARLMASQARRRALALVKQANEQVPESERLTIVGIAATASLASDRPKKGAHRVYCAVRTESAIFSAKLDLHKDARTRAEEERLAADFVLSTALFAATKLAAGVDAWRLETAELPLVTDVCACPEDSASVTWAALDEDGAKLLSESPDAPLAALCWQDGKRALVREVGVANPSENDQLAIYPGSFAPPHRGHIEIARIAEKRLQRRVALEISARNVDKPALDPIELLSRLNAIATALPGVDVWITNAPRYIQKAELFPGAEFIMGTDTVLRLADPKYENGSVERRDAIFTRMRELTISICVFARKVRGELRSESLLRETLPQKLCALCEFVPEDVFLDDISSSEIRKNAR